MTSRWNLGAIVATISIGWQIRTHIIEKKTRLQVEARAIPPQAPAMLEVYCINHREHPVRRGAHPRGKDGNADLYARQDLARWAGSETGERISHSGSKQPLIDVAGQGHRTRYLRGLPIQPTIDHPGQYQHAVRHEPPDEPPRRPGHQA